MTRLRHEDREPIDAFGMAAFLVGFWLVFAVLAVADRRARRHAAIVLKGFWSLAAEGRYRMGEADRAFVRANGLRGVGDVRA